MYNDYFAKISVDAASGASFMYAVARSYSSITSLKIEGADNLPTRPADCFIIFKVSVPDEHVNTFEKLARVSLTKIPIVDLTPLRITSLQDYFDLPYSVQVSPEGLAALQEFSAVPNQCDQVSVDQNELDTADAELPE